MTTLTEPQPRAWGQLITGDRFRRLSRAVSPRANKHSPMLPSSSDPFGDDLNGGLGPKPSKSWLYLTFLGFVVLPSIAAFCYYAFIASRQYASEAKFVVRGATQMMPIQGIALGASSISQLIRLNNNQEGAIIASYVQSAGMLEDVASELDLMQIYGRPDIDWLSRFPGLHPIEKATSYWLKMVKVHNEPIAGILTLRVAAFSPEDAQLLAKFILKRSEDLVNGLLAQARSDAVASSELEFRHSLSETAAARASFEELRDTEKLIDAENSARSLLAAESKLRQQKIELETELTILKSRVSPDMPVIRDANNRLLNIDNQIRDLQDQLIKARNRDQSISDAIRLYAQREFRLQMAEGNQDFADRVVGNALRESDLRHVYLEIYQPPTLTTKAVYPLPFWATMRFGGALLLVWLVGSMLFIRIREHVD